MNCSQCGSNKPTLVVYEYNQGKKNTLYLCQACALKQDMPEALKQREIPINLFFDEILKKETTLHIIKTPCQCGTYFDEIIDSGKTGCPNCYIHFKESLFPLLTSIYSKPLFKGKIPSETSKMINLHQKRARLEKKLEEAVTAEEYEKAAFLRDEIKYIKTRIGGYE